jgi:hypothetical protein
MDENTNFSSSHLIDPENLAGVLKILKRSREGLDSTVHGGSMGTTLPEGTRVRLRFSSPSEIAEGQVVAIAVNGRLIAHRVAHLGRSPQSKEFLVACGDAALLCDVPVHIRSVVGIITERLIGDNWTPLDHIGTHGWRRLISKVFTTIVGHLLDLNVKVAFWAVRGALRVRSSFPLRRTRVKSASLSSLPR